jgi:hypothetical protein
MTSKKFNSRNTRRFVPPPLPESLSKDLDVELRCIVQRFQSVTTKMPVDQIGASANSVRAEFVAKRVERWIADGLRCLARASVKSLLNDGYSEMGVIIPPGQNVPLVLIGVVTDGLTRGLDNLLKKVEESTVDLSDDLLRSFGLTDDCIEVFRRLLPSYSGTLDELLEAAATL